MKFYTRNDIYLLFGVFFAALVLSIALPLAYEDRAGEKTAGAQATLVDCHVCVQVVDNYACDEQLGFEECTPYASEGGGWSNWAIDDNGYDPDCVRVRMECR